MTHPPGGARPSPAHYRRYWLPDLLVLLGLAVVTTTAFWLGPLDLAAAWPFYYPGLEDNPFPAEGWPLWQFFYWCAPALAALLAGGGFVALIWGSLQPTRRHLALYGLFVLLGVVLGPGVVVNGIFKDNWGRPRPRQIIQLGGESVYQPPLRITTLEDGKSFPCGHCSVGFAATVFYFLWRRRRPRLAFAALAGAIGLGLLMGWGRMAAGAHFLSDVLWAGFLAFFVNWLLYYFILNIPGREDVPRIETVRGGRLSPPALVGYGLLALVLLFGILLATPVSKDLAYRVPAGAMAEGPETMDLIFTKGDVLLELTGPGTPPFEVAGTVRGFGFPYHTLREREDHDADEVRYRFEHEGLFTELDVRAHIRVNASHLRELQMRVGDGNVRVVVPVPLDHRPVLGIQATHVVLPEPAAFGQ